MKNKLSMPQSKNKFVLTTKQKSKLWLDNADVIIAHDYVLDSIHEWLWHVMICDKQKGVYIIYVWENFINQLTEDNVVELIWKSMKNWDTKKLNDALNRINQIENEVEKIFLV